MNKLFAIFLCLTITINLSAGNEGGNGGHDQELNWEQHSQQIERTLIHLKSSGEVSGNFEQDLKFLNSFMLTASKDFKRLKVDRANKVIKIPESIFSKLTPKEQFCQSWTVLKTEIKGIEGVDFLSCEYVRAVSNALYLGNWEMKIEDMLNICNKKPNEARFSYVCNLNNSFGRFVADNLIEATKKAAVLLEKENCSSLKNKNNIVILRVYTSLNKVECFRE